MAQDQQVLQSCTVVAKGSLASTSKMRTQKTESKLSRSDAPCRHLFNRGKCLPSLDARAEARQVPSWLTRLPSCFCTDVHLAATSNEHKLLKEPLYPIKSFPEGCFHSLLSVFSHMERSPHHHPHENIRSKLGCYWVLAQPSISSSLI